MIGLTDKMGSDSRESDPIPLRAMARRSRPGTSSPRCHEGRRGFASGVLL